MEFARVNKDKIIRLYVDEGKSTHEIAEQFKTYPNKIVRSLNYLGIPKRSYSEAQALAIKSGRSSHPTLGNALSDEHKAKIGKERSKAWAKMPAEERERLSSLSREQWNSMSESEQIELRRMAMAAVREASKSGSKTEKFIRSGLESNGYKVEYHKRDLVQDSKLELDMYLPELRTALEIDGPGHFSPIWGESKYQKQVAADTIKQGVLLNHGCTVLRVKQLDKSLSKTKLNDILAAILSILEEIKSGTVKNKLVEIEVLNGETKRVG